MSYYNGNTLFEIHTKEGLVGLSEIVDKMSCLDLHVSGDMLSHQ